MMKLSTILAAYSYEKARTRRLEAQQAGKLWEDDDFENYNKFCSKSLLEKPLTATRIFRAWEEGWEKVQLNSSGDDKFAAQFLAKYEGLRWVDFDSKMPLHSAEGDGTVLVKLGGQTARKQEKGKGWAYCPLGMYDGQYDESMSCLENDTSSYELSENAAMS